MEKFLPNIKSPKDLKKIDKSDLSSLCIEIRERIVDVMSNNSGHLGASLGAVELATAIHYVYNAPADSIVWDVGHQAYAHKILTGRNTIFDSIRKKNGLSGFLSRDESEYDCFGAGHSSTSISAITGIATGKKLNGNNSKNIAIIGDGSLTAGLAFEGINHLVTQNLDVAIIINDNNMSIDPNVGGLQEHLNNIEPNQNFFTNLGANYYGKYNGNDIDTVLDILEHSNTFRGVNVIHFTTKKGYGYQYSQDGNPTHWHAPGKFEVNTGKGDSINISYPKKYQDVIGETLIELAKTDENIVVITPAMATGSGLKEFEKLFPERFFDVGIAEQHAVTFSAGLAISGKIPICVIYSTFLQRAYDQVIHDVALQNLKVIFLIDRAGIVGNDGATHHGTFDLAYLNTVPNLTIFAPQDESQLHHIILNVALNIEGPVAIRYPRGKGILTEPVIDIKDFNSAYKLVGENDKNLIISIGAIGNQINTNHLYSHLSLLRVKPLNSEKLLALTRSFEKILILEDGAEKGGISNEITSIFAKNSICKSIKTIGIPDRFISHGDQDELYKELGLSGEKLEIEINQFFDC